MRHKSRALALAAVLCSGIALGLLLLRRHEPLAGWLSIHYLLALCCAGVFGATCLVSGHALLVRALGRTLPLEEHLAIALPLGVLAFFLVSNLFGWLGWYGTPFFVLAPLLLLGLGARDFWRSARRVCAHLARRELRPTISALRCALLAFGVLGLGLVWLTLLTPDNASVDARTYHLPLAENYVAHGGLVASSEGWVPAAFPQLASLIYVWAFSAPVALFDRIEIAAHLELAVLLMTLLGVTALARRLLGERAPFAWVALFLFPGIFCYDSGLVLGADHFAALWAAPIFLLCLRFDQSKSYPFGLLLGAVVAGAFDTKYTAAILLPLPLAVWLRAALARDAPDKRAARLALGASLASVLVLTAPTWLRNAVAYGDPLFPLLRRWLPAHPWSQAAEAPYAAWFELYRPRFGLAGVLQMFETLATFAFVPHDYPQYHGNTPVFGFLFTLCTPALLLLRPRRRVLALFAAVYLGLAAWFWLHQLDRYLQALVPWMAAGTAVVLTLAWREAALARVAVAGLVGLQLAWGAKVPFLASHLAAGGSILKIAVERLGGSGEYASRSRTTAYPTFEAIGKALPAHARVLVHEFDVHAGLSAITLVDGPGGQGAFYWGEPGSASAREIWTRLRAHGVTHLLWTRGADLRADTVAGGLAFFDFAVHHSKIVGTFSGLTLGELLPTPPPARAPGEVAYYPCDADPLFPSGSYPLSALARSAGDPRGVTPPIAGRSLPEAIARASYLVFDARCHGPLSAQARSAFELLAARGQAMLMVRRQP